MKYKKKDIAITDNGELATTISHDEEGNELKDLSLVFNTGAVKQSVNVRLKTNIREFLLHPNVGNELSNIVGERNTRETAELGRQYLINAITKYNYIERETLSITAIPSDEKTIIYTIQIYNEPHNSISFVLEIDLEDGIRRVIS